MNLAAFQPPVTPESLFLSLEGIEGSGKTTQLNAIRAYLEGKGYRCLVLREPGGTVFGEKLREAVLTSPVKLSPLAECHLFLASRAQLLQEKILPFLLEQPRSVVILDRYLDSTLAYQGRARRLGFETVLSLHQHHPLCLVPHRTYFLDISLETSHERQNKRGGTKDYFESQEAEFYLNLIDGYRQVARTFPDRVKTVDAERSETEVTKDILADLAGLVT